MRSIGIKIFLQRHAVIYDKRNAVVESSIKNTDVIQSNKV